MKDKDINFYREVGRAKIVKQEKIDLENKNAFAKKKKKETNNESIDIDDQRKTFLKLFSMF